MNNITDKITPTGSDIANAKFEYENTNISLQKISEKYGKYPMYWSRLAVDLEWEKYKPGKKNNTDGSVSVVFADPNGILEIVAVRKISEIIKELGSHYSPMDEPLIMAYGVLYQEFIRLSALISIEGDLVSNDKGVTYTNPRYNNFLAVVERMAKMGDRFGGSVVSRKRAGIAPGKDSTQQGLFDMLEVLSKQTSEDSDLNGL